MVVDASDLDIESRSPIPFKLKMIYKLLNKLFGWDYISWSNFADQGVARVHTSACGKVYYWRYKNTKVADEITNKEQVIWLTCPPEKYLK